MIARLALLIVIAALAACGPGAPEGVEKAALDKAVGEAIGDPGTCVLIAERGGRQVYRYGTHTVCGRSLPSCAGEGRQRVGDVLDHVAAGRPFETASCPSLDPARRVAWAAGPIEGRDLVYAAVMEGPNTPPGIVVADLLRSAFRRAGL